MEISNLVENPLLGMILLMAEIRLINQLRSGMLKSPLFTRGLRHRVVRDF